MDSKVLYVYVFHNIVSSPPLQYSFQDDIVCSLRFPSLFSTCFADCTQCQKSLTSHLTQVKKNSKKNPNLTNGLDFSNF